MPTLLILYPTIGTFCAETRAYLTEQRRLQGLRIVLADDCITASGDNVFDDIIKLPPSEYVKETYAILRNVCNAYQVDAIYLQSEAALPVGSLLTRDFELLGPSVESVHLCINKYLSRERLSQCGISIPQFILGENAADVYKAAAEFGYPLVLKGISSAHSRLVTLIPSGKDVESAVQYLHASQVNSQEIARLSSFAKVAHLELGCSPEKQFLIESFVGGDALESDGVITEGEPVTFGITEQIPSENPLFYIEGYMCPAERPPVELEELHYLSDSVLAAVDLHHSGFSIEMRVNANHACIIEVNSRLGRDDGFGDMFKIRTGTLPTLYALKSALGISPELTFNEQECVAIAYRSYYGDGIVEKLPRWEELHNLEYGDAIYGTMCEVGTRMYQHPHPNTYPHLAWVLATHPRSSRAAYQKAKVALDQLSISVGPIRP